MVDLVPGTIKKGVKDTKGEHRDSIISENIAYHTSIMMKKIEMFITRYLAFSKVLHIMKSMLSVTFINGHAPEDIWIPCSMSHQDIM